MNEIIADNFGRKLRIRVCGLYQQDGALLMVKHRNLGPLGELWIPPGGGAEYGSNLEENLQREFMEETGLEVVVGEYLFTYEFIDLPLHAVEFFFQIKSISGELKVGVDPELSTNSQIIERVEFVSFDKINSMNKNVLHGIFSKCDSAQEVFAKRGLFKFKNYT